MPKRSEKELASIEKEKKRFHKAIMKELLRAIEAKGWTRKKGFRKIDEFIGTPIIRGFKRGGIEPSVNAIVSMFLALGLRLEVTSVPRKAEKFRCPECKAIPHQHGSGDCQNRTDSCEGIICDCSEVEFPESAKENHGRTTENPCPNANCYHCGFGGTIPPVSKKRQKELQRHKT